MNFGEVATKDMTAGQRVALHPSTDAYAQGDRTGYVVKATTRSAYVRLDPSGRELRFPARDVQVID